MGVGQLIERELMCLWRAKLWEGLIPFAVLFEGTEPKKKSAKPDYDWRVVVAMPKENVMPAVSKAQRQAMAIAEHGKATPGSPSAGMAASMSKAQLHDFAATKEKGLPEHKKQRRMKKVQVDDRIKKIP